MRLTVAAASLLLLAMPAFASAGKEGGFDFGTAGQGIASLLIFGLLLVVLGKYAWKPIVQQLENREKMISDKIEHAIKRQEEAQGLLQQYQARLDQAEAQAAALMSESRKEAAEAREKILQTAIADAQKTNQQLRQEIEQAKQETMRALYDSTASLATEIAGKIIRRNLSVEDQKQILQESLEDIRANTAREQ